MKINPSSHFFALHHQKPDLKKTSDAAKKFESMTINQMLQPMFNTENDDQNMFSGGIGEQQFRPMLVEQIAKNMEKKGGIGLAKAINHQMLILQEKK
ncbi:rod-binding protein [Swingsia samuiensis]|uniref:Chemotaxis protein chel n=1 Tax=Swingsia samuiensis TaxID=1293412 RepID=A0A4Y6UJK0_9PROT|nr:rod-binding protein [Swingsia samuiensis]QDH16646.1 chemotaxis protein chel [Swingsia samuiensis]